MRPLLFLTISFFFFQGCTKPQPDQTPSPNKPNIILVMTDDQGYGDFGFTGNPDVKTPVLDEMASKSVQLEQFYVQPVCAPTRASLMTGRDYIKTGIYDTYNGGAIMAGEETTIAEILQNNGYTTGIFGKWHLGDNYPSRPQDQGFDETLVHLAGGVGQPGDYLNYFEFDSSYFDPVMMENGMPTHTKGYCSDVYTDHLIEFIENNQDQPFFAYLPFNAPHTPLQLPQKYYDMYADMEINPEEYPDLPRDMPEINENQLEVAKRVYGMVTNIDDNMGRILQSLEANNIQENTLIIFMTDNGPRGLRYNAGLREDKSSVYEGGIKVPCLMYYPGQFDPKNEVNVPAAHIDILPTILDMINARPPENIDGKSLLPLIRGKQVAWSDDRSLYFHWQRGYPEPYRNMAIRQGDYKLVGHTGHRAGINRLELFNITEDPYELNNIVERQPDIARDLKQNLDNWYDGVITNKNLTDPPRIAIGSRHENPVILNRNDAKGSPGMWTQDHIYAYWAVDVKQEGMYNIEIDFLDTLQAPGKYVLKIGTVQRTISNEAERKTTLKIQDIPLKEGKWRVESWYLSGKDEVPFVAPFTITIEKQ